MKRQVMTLAAGAILFALPIVGELGAQGTQPLVRFDGAIAVDPVASVAAPAGPLPNTFENVARNNVRGVRPGLTPWRIADLKATIDRDGHIDVVGRGLLVAAGDGLGTNLNFSVFATLICEATAPFIERNTASTLDGVTFTGAVPLEPNGDFHIADTLKLTGNAPGAVDECASPLLLVRTASGAWLAAGIQRIDK